MTYAEKLRDPRWQRKRLEVMQRDGFTCRDCGSTTETLHVHHCWYAKEPWEISDAYLLTLCEECHVRRDTWEALGRQCLGLIFSRLAVSDVEDLTAKLMEAGHGRKTAFVLPPPECVLEQEGAPHDGR